VAKMSVCGCACLRLHPPTTAAIATVSVPAGGSVSVTVVFSWYFPHRDHVGQNIGNFYSNLYVVRFVGVWPCPCLTARPMICVV
jgi:hypothetical protein